jgi:hypothetical protein
MKRALTYALTALVLTYVIRELLYVGIRKNKGGEFDKLNTAFVKENDYDILIIGSSRAECQFYPPIIDSATGLRSYNIGMTGAVMPFIAVSLEAYLENSAPPKYVILNLDLHSPGDPTDTVYKFPRYFAYLDNPKLYNGLSQCDSRFKAFRWISVYSMPYFGTKYLSNSLHGWMQIPTDYDRDYVQGFAPSTPTSKVLISDTLILTPTNNVPSIRIIEALDKIREVCDSNNVQLILTLSPLYHRQEEAALVYQKSKNTFESYADKFNLVWIDLSSDSLRFRSELYSDPAHLNKQGAMVFSRHFSEALRQYIKE